MPYLRPEMEIVRFATCDILTDSNELPIIPAEIEDDLESFDEPVGGED